MTPRHLAAVWRHYTDQEERAERRTGVQMLQIANLMRDTKEHPEPYTLADIIGHNGSVAQTSNPSLAEFLEAKHRGEQIVRAHEAGLPNPFPANPQAQDDIGMARDFTLVSDG